MYCFVTGKADLVVKELYTAMLDGDITLARIMVYKSSIKESKHKRMARKLNRGGSRDQAQPRFKKRAQTQEEPRSAKVKFERVGG